MPDAVAIKETDGCEDDRRDQMREQRDRIRSEKPDPQGGDGGQRDCGNRLFLPSDECCADAENIAEQGGNDQKQRHICNVSAADRAEAQKFLDDQRGGAAKRRYGGNEIRFDFIQIADGGRREHLDAFGGFVKAVLSELTTRRSPCAKSASYIVF